MNYLSIDDIKNKVNDLLEKIDCPKNIFSLPTYESAIGDGTPYIMANELGYHYIYSERGVDFQKHITKDIDELLFWICKDIVFDLVDKRNKERAEWFKEEENIMAKINQDWAKLLSKEHKKLLIGMK
jgi:hypothetical protein